MLHLFDTASQTIAELAPRTPRTIGLYVCGPTVYGPPHVGHGRSVLVYDVLRRYLEYQGVKVRHVSNITDIDDKIFSRANKEQRSWQEVAAEFEEEWWATMDAMSVQRPTDTPHASDYVSEMVVLIESLIERNAAYETSDGVYLKAAEVPNYGLLSHQSIDSRRVGARVELDEEKLDPIDFVLWKKAKPDEPTWPSPWGPGRPGWHTECVVMSLALLGEDFELHGGGQDLIFPHHDNERAQAIADGHRFARHWMHNGLVTVAGEKMSKSLNNFTTLSDLLKHCDARSYRMLVVQAHYRSPLEVNTETIEAAASALERIDTLVRRFSSLGGDTIGDAISTLAAERLRERFVAAMDNDLDTPGAIAEIFEAVRNANSLGDAGQEGEAGALTSMIVELCTSLGINIDTELELDRATSSLIARRDEARTAGDFPTADRLRAELEAQGWRVEDTPGGTRVRK